MEFIPDQGSRITEPEPLRMLRPNPMSQSLANLIVHLVFSTKMRRPLLRDKERGDLHAYLTGILKNHAPARIVEQIKSSSSEWIKTQAGWYFDFSWQAGYGEFSVSPMHVEAVREYVRKQPEHHLTEDFQTEYRRFCEKNGKPLDERYAWE